MAKNNAKSDKPGRTAKKRALRENNITNLQKLVVTSDSMKIQYPTSTPYDLNRVRNHYDVTGLSSQLPTPTHLDFWESLVTTSLMAAHKISFLNRGKTSSYWGTNTSLIVIGSSLQRC